MLNPRIWTLHEADSLVIGALRRAGEDPKVARPVTVRFSGSLVASEYFRRDMVVTGWEITELSTIGNSTTITMEWEATSDDDTLRALSARLLKIASGYGVIYDGWSIPIIPGERSNDS
jgi:hypothetical protein